MLFALFNPFLYRNDSRALRQSGTFSSKMQIQFVSGSQLLWIAWSSPFRHGRVLEFAETFFRRPFVFSDTKSIFIPFSWFKSPSDRKWTYIRSFWRCQIIWKKRRKSIASGAFGCILLFRLAQAYASSLYHKLERLKYGIRRKQIYFKFVKSVVLWINICGPRDDLIIVDNLHMLFKAC